MHAIPINAWSNPAASLELIKPKIALVNDLEVVSSKNGILSLHEIVDGPVGRNKSASEEFGCVRG